MADVDVVRTVFQTEWLGGGVVSNMIRQYGLAEKAIAKLQGKRAGGGGMSALTKTASQAKFTSGAMGELGRQVAAGEKSFAMASLEASKFDAALSSGATSAGGLTAGLSPMVIGLTAVAAAVAAAVIAFKKLYPVLKEGAEIAQLDASFQHLNRTMTESPNLLDEMKRASQGTVTTMAAQEGFMTLVAGSSRDMTMALADAAPKLLEISKAANKLNPALGDTNFMFTSLAKGVKRAEPRLIDNLGLKLRVSDANRQLAKELGKSVAELTAEEKQLAILNETLRAGDALIRQVGGSAAGLGDSFQRIASAREDVTNTFKRLLFLSIDLTGALEGATNAMNTLESNMNRVASIRFGQRQGFLDTDELITRNRLILMYGAGTEKVIEEEERLIALIKQREALAAREESRFLTRAVPLEPVEEARTPNLTGAVGEELRATRIIAALEASAKTRHNVLVAAEEDYKAQVKAAEEWAKGVNKASKEAREAWIAYTAELGAIAKGHAEAGEESSFFTSAIEDIGDAWVTTGGATKEQRKTIDELQGAYDRAETAVRQLQSGVKGFGQDEEKIAEQIEKNLDAMEYYKTKIGEVAVANEVTSKVHKDAVWNWDNLRGAMADAASEAGISATQFTNMKVAMGDMTSEQAEAIIAASAMETKMGELAERMKFEDGFDFSDAEEELRRFAGWLDKQDLSILVTPTLQSDTTIADMILNEVGAEEGRIGGIPIDVDAAEGAKDARDTLKEILFGEGVLPPAKITATVDISEAEETISLFRQVQGEAPIKIPIEFILPGSIGGLGDGGLSKNAGGGNVLANQMALVGEQGPELIVPGSNSTVIPNNKLGGLGGNVEINITVAGGEDDGLAMIIEDRLLEAMQQIGLV